MIAANKLNKKENLLDQGVQLLTQQGYHGTGLKEILDAVQIPKGSFYNYFPSKEHYAVEVIGHYIEPYITLLNSHLQSPGQDGLAGLKNYFAELTTELEKANFKGGCLLGNLMGEIGDTSAACQEALRSAYHRYRDLLAYGLQKAQAEGTVRTDKSAVDMADLLANTWQGALLRMKIEQSSSPLKQCCRDLLDDFFRV